MAKVLDQEPTKSSCNKKEKWFRGTIRKAESENNSTVTARGPDNMEQIKIEELDAYFTDKLDFYQQKNNRIILKPFAFFACLISVRGNHPDEEK